jgi:hypothetical protein
MSSGGDESLHETVLTTWVNTGSDDPHKRIALEFPLRFDAANEQDGRNRGSTASCGSVGIATRWPGDQIEKAVRADLEQQAKLDALKSAMTKASDDLANACPSTLPATPPAISRRLDVMLQAIKNVHAALDDFYNSLSAEQKAQFNMIGRQQTARR